MGKALKLSLTLSVILIPDQCPCVAGKQKDDYDRLLLPGGKLANVSLNACGKKSALSLEGLNDLNINKQLFLPVSCLKNV